MSCFHIILASLASISLLAANASAQEDEAKPLEQAGPVLSAKIEAAKANIQLYQEDLK